MSDLAKLVEQCEKASGPDRELNLCIHEALGNCVHRETKFYCIEDGNDSDSGFTCLACRKDTYGFTVPNYTASLDAALTLVPEGCLWTMESWSGPRWSAGIWRDRTWLHLHKDHRAATPALALCAASLRAISSMRDSA